MTAHTTLDGKLYFVEVKTYDSDEGKKEYVTARIQETRFQKNRTTGNLERIKEYFQIAAFKQSHINLLKLNLKEFAQEREKKRVLSVKAICELKMDSSKKMQLGEILALEAKSWEEVTDDSENKATSWEKSIDKDDKCGNNEGIDVPY